MILINVNNDAGEKGLAALKKVNAISFMPPGSWIETEPGYKCSECESVFDRLTVEDAGPIYECADGCGNFNRDASAGYNHQCPTCNKFAGKLAEFGCPECYAEVEETQVISDPNGDGYLAVSD